MADNGKKKSRNAITLDSKIKMIKLSDEGLNQAEIGRRLGFPRTTVHTVIKSRQKILDEVRSATPVNTTIIRKKDGLVADMERLLMVWIDYQASCHLPLNQAIIQTKARSLFNDMKAERGDAAKDVAFGASRGWFDRFKKRSNLHSFKVQGEADTVAAESFPPDLVKIIDDCGYTTDQIFNVNEANRGWFDKFKKTSHLRNFKVQGEAAAAESFPQDLAKIIDDCGYTKDQIFNVDETGLFWKKMPSRTFIAKEEKTTPGFKPAKDRMTLLLGANASGTLKLKPMLIYRLENPGALKNYVKTRLPVHWRSNAKVSVTAALFEEWFDSCFVPEVKDYCKEKKVPFKILLLLDGAPGHPRRLDDLHPNVQVVFLPTNTASLLQPMDQCVTAAFKLYYLRRTFGKCIRAIDAEEGSGKEGVRKFWQGFTILDGIKTVRDAWNDVEMSTLKGAWKKLCPQLLDEFEDFENPIPEVTEHIVEMATQLELQVEAVDVAELIEAHSQPLCDEDLLSLEEQEEVVPEEVSIVEPKGLTSKVLAETFRHFEAGMALLEKHDPDFERSSKVNANLVRDYACYTEIYREKKGLPTSQTHLRKRPVPSTSTESPSPKLTSTQSPTPAIVASRSPLKTQEQRLTLDGSIYAVQCLLSPSDFLP